MPARFTLRQLGHLVAVARVGIDRAARPRASAFRLPSISSAIGQLEAEFGAPLSRRHAQGMSLTPIGRALVEKAQTVLDSARALSDEAALLSGLVRGDLSMGCLLTFAQILAPQLRRSFVAAYPEVRLHQAEDHQAGLIAALRDARLDMALTYDLAIPTDLEFTALASFPPYAMFSATHPLAERESVALEDLRPCRWCCWTCR
ncbi:MAG: LysR substrate-binding domain-containing protein [Paracoccaceae bacterium]